ncbi:MAG: hypothetical protein NW214_14670 [Pseudanabaenaceae cyanobacterium bins.39]|nr:hypothetical protein [Pseudanabaenaceae cyanobacterium bins.39]
MKPWNLFNVSGQLGRLFPWCGYFFLMVVAATPVGGQEPLKPIAPRFKPDPQVYTGATGGRVPLSELVVGKPNGSCQGFSSQTPNHTLTIQRDFGFLSMQVSADRRLTLMVKGPDGVFCRSGQKAELTGAWVSGKYEIWVGTDNGDRTDYRLSISETSQ